MNTNIKIMSKQYGQDLKNNLETAKRALNNATVKINKRFDMILDEYGKYICDDDKNYMINNSVHDLSLEQKCGIIIRTEAEYVRQNSNQGELFN